MVFPVKLYVYDVTQGMARQMSPFLIGRQLDGVWHTAVMVYGNEYFFGGGGISFCPPSGTILGHPTEIVDLGTTEVPIDMFHEYLVELGTDRFNGSRYHLLNHNCNTFSDEIAEFLTGQRIPGHITNLPAEIMATPFGAMLRPYIDSMMMDVAAHHGTHITTSDSHSAAPVGPTASSNAPAVGPGPTNSATSGQNAEGEEKKNVPPKNSDIDLD